MSKRSRPQAIAPTVDPEEFMALLLHAQTNPCSCVFARYFKKMGQCMVKQHIKESEPGG